MFQWVNVKGWVMVIGTITAYSALPAFHGISHTGALSCYGHRCRPWPGRCSGSSLRSFLTSPTAVRVFNVLMAALLLASLYPVFMDA